MWQVQASGFGVRGVLALHMVALRGWVGFRWVVVRDRSPGWGLCCKCSSPYVRFKGVGGFGLLMFEEVLGAFMALMFLL